MSYLLASSVWLSMLRTMRNRDRSRLSLFSARWPSQRNFLGQGRANEPEIGRYIGDHLAGHRPLLVGKSVDHRIFAKRIDNARDAARIFEDLFHRSSEKTGGSGAAPARSKRDRT